MPPSGFLHPLEIDLSIYHLHAITYILATSLIVMVQFDNTALSAGNFISVALWLCVAVSGAIKREALGMSRHGSSIIPDGSASSPLNRRLIPTLLEFIPTASVRRNF